MKPPRQQRLYQINWVQILATSHVIQGPGGQTLSQLAHEKTLFLIVAREAGQCDSRKQKKTSGPPVELNFSFVNWRSLSIKCQQRYKRHAVIWRILVLYVCIRLNEWRWQFPSRKVRQVLIPHCQRLPPCLLISLPGITRPLETETKTAGTLITPLNCNEAFKSLIPLCSIMAAVEETLMNYYHSNDTRHFLWGSLVVFKCQTMRKVNKNASNVLHILEENVCRTVLVNLGIFHSKNKVLIQWGEVHIMNLQNHVVKSASHNLLPRLQRICSHGHFLINMKK